MVAHRFGPEAEDSGINRISAADLLNAHEELRYAALRLDEDPRAEILEKLERAEESIKEVITRSGSESSCFPSEKVVNDIVQQLKEASRLILAAERYRLNRALLQNPPMN